MKFGVAKEHLSFFCKQGYIEFESLLSQEDVAILEQEISQVLSLRLNAQKKNLHHQLFSTLYKGGFDIWRSSDQIKKILFRRQLSEVAATLVKKKKIRFGFDQLFCVPHFFEEEASFLTKENALRTSTCLQGVLCGLILNVGGQFDFDQESMPFLPSKVGNGLFVSPDLLFSFAHLLSMPTGAMQILIVYAEEKAIYRHCEEHLNTHAYKRLDYVFGDRLRNSTHPLICGF